MKTFDVFNKWQLDQVKRYLLDEQAISRSDAESGISHLADTLIEHLLKVLVFGPNCSAYNHWMSELNKWFKKISEIKLKPKSYHPTLKDVRKWAREEPLEDYRSYINTIEIIICEENIFIPIAEELLKDNFDSFCHLYDSILSTCCNKPTYTINILNDIIKNWFNIFKEVYGLKSMTPHQNL